MSDTDKTIDNVSSYDGFSQHSQLTGAEQSLFTALITPGMRVLDIGCGTGRIAQALQRLNTHVDACDLNTSALEILKRDDASGSITVKEGDARALPYDNCQFDFVIFAFNGLDFLYPESERHQSIMEMARVLKSGGICIFSSHNPIGELLSPHGVKSIHSWKYKIRLLFSGATFQDYHLNHQGLFLYHSTPKKIVSQVESTAPLRFERMINKAGNCSSPFLLSLFSQWPYYQFRKL